MLLIIYNWRISKAMASKKPNYWHLEWKWGHTEASILGHTKCNIDFVSGKQVWLLSWKMFTGTGPYFTMLCSFGTHWSGWKWACRSTSLIKINSTKVGCIACNTHMLVRVSVELWWSLLLPFSEPHAAVISIVSGCNLKFPASFLKICFLATGLSLVSPYYRQCFSCLCYFVKFSHMGATLSPLHYIQL